MLAPRAEQPGAAEGQRREGRLEQDPLASPTRRRSSSASRPPSRAPPPRSGRRPSRRGGCGGCGRPGRRRGPSAAAAPGVPKAPPATIVAAAGADRVGRRLPLRRRPTAQRTPAARPSSTRTRRASTPVRSRAPGGDRAGQVADVHAPLGVDRAAVGAGAALHAAAGVAGDRAAAGADGFRALHRQLAVAAHPLGVERGHPQELLGLGEVGLEVAGPARPRSARASRSSTGSGARKQVPELITVVPPTARPTGTGIGGRPSAIVSPPSR